VAAVPNPPSPSPHYEILIHNELFTAPRDIGTHAQRNPNLPYTWPEDDLGLKQRKFPGFPLIIALVMCIAFGIVFLIR
jgi:hypothetical protein